jgi:hypothetical protein
MSTSIEGIRRNLKPGGACLCSTTLDGIAEVCKCERGVVTGESAAFAGSEAVFAESFVQGEGEEP